MRHILTTMIRCEIHTAVLIHLFISFHFLIMAGEKSHILHIIMSLFPARKKKTFNFF